FCTHHKEIMSPMARALREIPWADLKHVRDRGQAGRRPVLIASHRRNDHGRKSCKSGERIGRPSGAFWELGRARAGCPAFVQWVSHGARPLSGLYSVADLGTALLLLAGGNSEVSVRVCDFKAIRAISPALVVNDGHRCIADGRVTRRITARDVDRVHA